MFRNLTRVAGLALALVALPAWSADTVTPAQLNKEIKAGDAPLIIDVRSEEEYLDGHVPNARLIPVDQIKSHMDSLKGYKDQPVVVYCQSGNRASKAAEKLEDAGFSKIEMLEGSFQGWQDSGGKIAE